MHEYVRFKKLKAVDNPRVPTPTNDEYKVGCGNYGTSVPVEYTVTGTLQCDIEVGKPILLFRNSRNGVKVSGIMTTSWVQSIEPKEGGLIIHTDNSVYDLEWLDDLN